MASLTSDSAAACEAAGGHLAAFASAEELSQIPGHWQGWVDLQRADAGVLFDSLKTASGRFKESIF